MNTTADPCEDFNQFACGSFIKDIPIPEGQARISPFTIARMEMEIKAEGKKKTTEK